ncbi:hypothetical protein [Kordia sp.]|uniref:hypothetical protein n=1 Tax=Kordia sp. TaxID=1965332 RepID=UPI0025B887ED|nr:hypothetical protein [Kordia sp.]MCH2194117.1 hypothetical protein [Kordia sp.]
MKKPLFLAFIALSLSIISCSNDGNIIPEPEENFFALTVGNSWVYEHCRRENQVTAVYNSVGVIDSIKITGTEIIDGNEFYKYRIRTSGNDTNNPIYRQNRERFQYLRDSTGYLFNQLGDILFSGEDEQEFLASDGATYPVYSRRGEGTETISTLSW